MKNMIRLMAFSVASIFLCNAQAEIVLSSEAQMKALPKLFRKEFPPFRPPNEECRFTGKRVSYLSGKGDLWFIVNTCGGSGGAPMSIALVSGGHVSVLFETTAKSSITILDENHGGFPDLQVMGAMAAYGAEIETFRHVEKSYTTAEFYRDMLLSQQTGWEALPDVSRNFFLKQTKKNTCIQQAFKDNEAVNGYPLAEKNADGDIHLVSSECLDNGKIPVWVIAAQPTPHIILHASTTSSQSGSPVLRTGPGKAHGLSDLCILNDVDKPSTRCWRYDGATYRPLPQ